MSEGLVGGFSGAMSGLTQADVDRYERDQFMETPPIDTRIDHEPDRAIHDDASTRVDDAEHPPTRRPVEPLAASIAERLIADPIVEPAKELTEVEANDDRGLVIVVGASRHLVGASGTARLVIGREPESGDGQRAVVDRGVVSRSHCIVAASADGVHLIDLGSSNGTVVVRRQQQLVVGADRVELSAGDVIATAGGAVVIATVEGPP